MEKYVYLFNEGNKDMRELLGGKGANLAEMTNIGLPVPYGFTVTTKACNNYYKSNELLDDFVIDEIKNAIEKLEIKTGKKFGDNINPLLLSVRSGARISMPGMMDTILNLGLNDEIAYNYSIKTNNKRFVYDSYRRLIQMYSDVVKGLPKNKFEAEIDLIKKENNLKSDLDLSTEDMVLLVDKFKNIYKSLTNEDFPQNPMEQLINAIKAVFKSWNNERAIYYRKINNISSSWGTAVNVQEMVYGNINSNSGTGVAFTRNPATGEDIFFGEYLMNAQGEDVVAGVRTPKDINTLKELMPNIYDEFISIGKKLENHYKDMQDMEFTIENGKLYILQTRNGKRTARAAIKIAVDMVNENMITKKDAIMRIEPKELDNLLHPLFNEESLKNAKVIAKGLAASPGAGVGKVYFDSQSVINAKRNGEDAILVRLETSPEDIKGMHSSNGVLTIRGGMTSHAAVVARGMGICCVSGVNDLTIDDINKTIKTKSGEVIHEGDYISINGGTGDVYLGKIMLDAASITGEFETFMLWVDEEKNIKVRANADTPKDAKVAKSFGAEGIGLCRTEHMFFDSERIFNFRKMICATTKEERILALEKILPYQEEDFMKIFEVTAPNPVVVRLLDPPLHEFLPKKESEIEELAISLGKSIDEIKNIVSSLKEFNPMMGHRGCRLAITYPEIARMQARAIISAGIKLKQKGINIKPEIMIPLVGDINEYRFVKNIVCDEINKVFNELNTEIEYEIGTMIEVPRATLVADEIAKEAEFFSFGTNDLTQMTFGFSRDDASKFLNTYLDQKILECNPFNSIDIKGVGALVNFAKEQAKEVNPNIELGICGEHGGDPKSIEFFVKVGLDYVSCSPYRVPVARLAAAQASINEYR